MRIAMIGAGYVGLVSGACFAKDTLALMKTARDAYRALDLDRVRGAMRGRIVIDLRNVCRPDDMARRGFAGTSVGRPSVALASA